MLGISLKMSTNSKTVTNINKETLSRFLSQCENDDKTKNAYNSKIAPQYQLYAHQIEAIQFVLERYEENVSHVRFFN